MWGAIIAGLAMILVEVLGSAANKKSQREQQQRLIDQQKNAQNEQSLFNQGLALDTWDKTNIPEQVRQIRESGLNVGLMYEGKGGSGTTVSQPGQVQGAMADAKGLDLSGALGSGMGMGMEAQMQREQIKNIQADTEKKKVEADNLKGIDLEKKGAEITNIEQTTTNAKLQAKLMELDRQIKEVDLNVKGESKDAIIETLEAQKDKLKAEAKKEGIAANVAEGTQKEQIEQAALQNKKTKTDIKQTEQTTTNLKQDEIQKQFDNVLRANGLQPSDNAAYRIASRIITNSGSSLERIQAKIGAIKSWLQGANGSQTKERFMEIWNQ